MPSRSRDGSSRRWRPSSRTCLVLAISGALLANALFHGPGEGVDGESFTSVGAWPRLSRSPKRLPGVWLQAESTLSYGDATYWDRRYSTGDKGIAKDDIDDRGLGWLCEYAGPVQQTLNAITGGDKAKTILNVGCGIDRFSEEVYKDGFTNLLCSDIAPSAIQEMSTRTASTMPLAKWFVDDATDMSVPSESIDVLLDKGTLDSVLILQSPFSNAARMLREVQRVLRPGGVYLLITHGRGDPDTWRLPLLALPHLNFNVAKTPDLGGYYLFVCTKLGDVVDPDAKWAEAEAWASKRDLEDREAELDAIDDIGQ